MPFTTKEMDREMKKQEKLKKEEQLTETRRQEEAKRKKEEEEARVKAEKEAQERARLAAETKARQEAEWRDKMRRFLATFRRAKCDPVVIVDEETFANRHGLVINRTELASTNQAQIYPAKREKPRLSTATVKPEDPAEAHMVVRVTVLDKCSLDYRKHLCANSLKLIKFLGSPESAVCGGTSPTCAKFAAANTALRHPSLVRIFDTFYSDKKVYIFMEELPPTPLSARIKHGPGLTSAEATSTGRQIGDALLFFSRLSLAHLNVRADNFIWNTEKQIKMVGLSRIFQYWDADLEQKILHKSIQERNYTDHFPAEVCREGQDFDAAVVDVFSFGILLYQMLLREKPFVKRQPYKGTEDMRILWEEHCADRKEKMKQLTKATVALLEQMLASKPAERPTLEVVLENGFFQGSGENGSISNDDANKQESPAAEN